MVGTAASTMAAKLALEGRGSTGGEAGLGFVDDTEGFDLSTDAGEMTAGGACGGGAVRASPHRVAHP